jgi:NADPH:quinone reductase-like Zn-dependent oxidoreductase
MHAQARQHTTTPTEQPVPRTMRAIVQDRYGSLDTLAMREREVPTPAAGQVLVEVRAAGLHAGDCFAVRGRPFPVRFATGLTRPKVGIPGFDLAGRVVAVGPKVTRLRPGDEVFGVAAGSCAEYVCAAEAQLAPLPAGLTFEEAAALPTSALAALHGLRAGKLAAGHKVLINGASGGVGTFAVQIARALGAEVTGVCSTANVDTVRSLGAHHVIDYTRENFTEGGPRYDLILDNIENHPLAACRRALTPRGTLVLNSGTGATGLAMLRRLLAPLVLSPFVSHDLRRFLSTPNHADLVALKDMVEAGSLRPIIAGTHPLHDTARALALVEGRHVCGKLVVSIDAA